MTAVDLHALPAGSVVATRRVVAHLSYPTLARPWTLAGSGERYTAGDLLAMSRHWGMLRYGHGDDEAVWTPHDVSSHDLDTP